MPQVLNRDEFKLFAAHKYDEFEARGVSVELAAKEIESEIEKKEAGLHKLHMLRNDISTHMGAISDSFDRNKHTHNFANI
jgi:hypothetical protein